MTVKVFSNPKDISAPMTATAKRAAVIQLKPEHAAIAAKISFAGLSVDNILLIIKLILTALSAVPVIGADAALASALIALYQKATAAYQEATGKPFDVNMIPLEEKV
jgi:hypothetical protein